MSHRNIISIIPFTSFSFHSYSNPISLKHFSIASQISSLVDQFHSNKQSTVNMQYSQVLLLSVAGLASSVSGRYAYGGGDVVDVYARAAEYDPYYSQLAARYIEEENFLARRGWPKSGGQKLGTNAPAAPNPWVEKVKNVRATSSFFLHEAVGLANMFMLAKLVSK